MSGPRNRLGVFYVAALTMSLIGVANAVNSIKVDPASHTLVDDLGRTRVFHGVNAVFKIPPWVPESEGFDAELSLSEVDAQNLKEWGFNLVRLGTMWPGVEPLQGQYNYTYLEEVKKITTILEKYDIYVILDMHQDLFHRMYCGEGVPDYVYEICKGSQSDSVKPFPAPLGEAMPTDETGAPDLDSCLNRDFFMYYFTAEVSSGFQCLYDNTDNLWDHLSNMWKTVAEYFKDQNNVLGYEIINEPWSGDIYADIKTLVKPGYTEETFLQPMYKAVNKGIREADQEKIVFFEGLTYDVLWHSGFTDTPGGPEYNDREVMSYHIYCPSQHFGPIPDMVCRKADEKFFNLRFEDVERIGGGWMLTEFGAMPDDAEHMQQLQQLTDLADKYMQSWAYWSFKDFNDITTANHGTQAMYQDGEISEAKLQVLSRAYAQAVAGPATKLQYLPNAKTFVAVFTPNSNEATTIFFNRARDFPKGVRVQASDEVVVKCDGNYVHVSTTARSEVELKLVPCQGFRCTC